MSACGTQAGQWSWVCFHNLCDDMRLFESLSGGGGARLEHIGSPIHMIRQRAPGGVGPGKCEARRDTGKTCRKTCRFGLTLAAS